MKKFISALLLLAIPSVSYADVIMGSDPRLDSLEKSIPYEIITPVLILALVVGFLLVARYKKRK